MTGEIFRTGSLDMPSVPFGVTADAVSWSGCTANRIVVAAAVILILIDLLDLLSIMPAIIHCLRTSRGAGSLEHSISVARSRNISAAVLLVAFLLMADRFGLYGARFLSAMPFGTSLAALTGIAAAFLGVRALMHGLVKPARFGAEDRQALKRLPYTIFIPLVIMMLVTTGLCVVFDMPEDAIRNILNIEIIASFCFSTIRAGQILAANCNGFSTILYLCALELLPAALLVASAVIL